MTGTSRQQATAARKDQIIGAAVALLAERGYQATTFDAIREYAGLSSKRLITYHFSNKDDLFAAIAAGVVADAEDYLRPAIDEASGPREILFAVIRNNVRFMAANMDRMRALKQIIDNGGDPWRGPHTDSLKAFERLFAAAQDAGEIRPGNPAVMAAVLRGALDAMYQPLEAGISAEACADELLAIFEGAFTRRSSSTAG